MEKLIVTVYFDRKRFDSAPTAVFVKDVADRDEAFEVLDQWIASSSLNRELILTWRVTLGGKPFTCGTWQDLPE